MTPSQRKEERPIAALIAPDILALLEESPSDVAAETEEMHAADLADVAESLPIDQVKLLLRVLPAERAADVLEYLDEELRAELLEEMPASQAAKLVSEMTPDDRVDVLEELRKSARRRSSLKSGGSTSRNGGATHLRSGFGRWYHDHRVRAAAGDDDGG
jgi:magnesium transporter